MPVSAIIALTRVTKAIRDEPWWRVCWWRFGGGEMTFGGEFAGGEVTINRSDHENQTDRADVCARRVFHL